MTNFKFQIKSKIQNPNALKIGNWKLFVICFLVVGIFFSPLLVSAQNNFHFVPCGRSDQQTAGNPDAQCQFRHLIILIVRIINYLISVAGIVAMYQVLLNGWNLVTSMGNPDKIQKAKAGLSNAVVGFAIVALSFVFVNLLANGIFGGPGAQREWWRADCLYNPGATGCPITTISPTGN